jgi:hypothetical protein
MLASVDKHCQSANQDAIAFRSEKQRKRVHSEPFTDELEKRAFSKSAGEIFYLFCNAEIAEALKRNQVA